MLVFAFFAAVFSSVSWAIYALLYIYGKLNETALGQQNPAELLMFVAILAVPVMLIWMIFGYVNQFVANRDMNKKQTALLTQLQKNQDYTDLVVRVMLDAEHEIKDGFVINKFDVLISDMNEALAEIIQRCNIASSAQMDVLWQRVKRGERWSLGKAILEASKSQSTFDAWVREKVNRDKVFRGSLLEFCSRYQNLLQLLEKHDRDRIFLHIIEAGVFGKVYSIIAPLTEGIKITQDERMTVTSSAENDYTSVLKLATMQEPNAQNTIINVDKNDEDAPEEYDNVKETKPSFFSRFNPFNRHRDDDFADEETEVTDPFFKALHNSFQDEKSPSFSSDETTDFPIFSNETTQDAAQPIEHEEPSMSDGPFHRVNLLNEGIKAQKESFEFSADTHFSANETVSHDEPSLSAAHNNTSYAFSQVSASNSNKKNEDENLVYPFGGWTDEDKYAK